MSQVRVIISVSNSPFFNLATEEYLLHQVEDDIVFLYDNSPSVVVGKHQNAFEECNQMFCESKKIDVVRRLSGGGTVFHGSGNLNFCFIQNGKNADQLIDFKKFLFPVNAYLNSIGVPSEYSGRNDLLVNGFKISGNAEHIYSKKKRVIHHGTLLFNADLKTLNTAIKPKENIKFKTHAVKSVRSTVANINEFLPDHWTYDHFKSGLAFSLLEYYSGQTQSLTQIETNIIHELVKSKYCTWDWNFGYSPGFEVELDLENEQTINLSVKKGVITSGQLNNQKQSIELNNLIGKVYKPESLLELEIDTDFKRFF